MNTIFLKQNEPPALEYQAASRYYYNKVDVLNNFYWLGVFVAMFIKVIWSDNEVVNCVLIGWFFLSFILDNFICNKIEKGAHFKQKFDYYVFNWLKNIPSEDVDSIRKIKAKNSEWFESQITHTGNDEPKGVKDWYEFVDSKTNQLNAMKKAMEENVKYDNDINTAFLYIICILAGLFIFFLFKDVTLINLLITLFISLSSLAKKVLVTVWNIHHAQKLNVEIEKELNYAKTMEDLEKIQNKIHNKRKITETTPNWIYHLRKKRITKMLRNYFQ